MIKFFSTIFITCFFFTSCKTTGKFANHPLAEKTISHLKEFIAKLDKTPDDPVIFDTLQTKENKTNIKISEPYWIVPSSNLPENIQIRKSNNNVSICIFKHKFYIAFRTGPYHFASKKSGIYILSTSDFTNWNKEFELFPGRDVREPYLIEINDTLHFYCYTAGTSLTKFNPDRVNHYILENDKWMKSNEVLGYGEVHWEMKKRYDKVFVTTYAGEHYKLKGKSNVRLHFKETTDGVHFTPADSNEFVYHGGASECAFEFDKDSNLWAITRLEDGDTNGFGSQVAYAEKKNYRKWHFSKHTDPNCYMSPRMFRYHDEIYLIARKQKGKKPFARTDKTKSLKKQRIKNWVGFSLSPKTTALYRINKNTLEVEWVADLPGCGDTAFPSIIRLSNNKFLVANYSSPFSAQNRSWLKGQFGKTGIYLIIISFDEDV